MNRLAAVVVAIACAMTPAPGLAAADTAADARQILIDRQTRYHTQSDEHVGELVVTAANGTVRRKQWRSYRQGSGATANRLIRFFSPPDIRGVGYLLRQRPGRPPDEWLYLPSMKRERRIVAADRQSAFVGTDFSYEDLEEFDEAQYDLTLLPERTVDGKAAHVIELVPRGRSAYERKILVIRKADLCLLGVEYYRRGERGLSKRLDLLDYTDVQGLPIAMRMEMADVRKGSKTVVLLRDVVLNRPQPADRYTIENLLREDSDPPSTALNLARLSTARVLSRVRPQATDPEPPRVGRRFTGYFDGRLFGYLGIAGGHDTRTEEWGHVLLRYSTRLGAARFSAALRAEQSSSSRAGPLVFDPADRQLARSPISIRELSIVMPLMSGVDLKVGRFQVAWGQIEEFSPADAFLPRDSSDPLTEERLPLWGAQLRGERAGLRFEVFVAPTTTPWRLPAFDGRHSPLSFAQVFFVDAPSPVPTRGFQWARVEGAARGWDIGVWARTGVRPAPILEPRAEVTLPIPPGTFIPVGRRFADETGVGLQLSHAYYDWLVHGELAVLRSRDRDLGNAFIWTTTLSHTVRNGMFVGTFGMNAIKPPADPLLLLDRALLPAFLLGVRQNERWGMWKMGWLGTFDRVGGVLTMEAVKDVTDVVKLTGGLDLPYGAALSPARAFAGDKRVRMGARWEW